MSSSLKNDYARLTDYTQAQEDVLAATLTGKTYGWVKLFNTDLGVARVWDGSVFISTSIFGLSGTKAEFDAALSDGNFVFVGDNIASFVLTGFCTTTAPADSTRYYFGSDFALGATTSANITRIYPSEACTLKSVFLKTRCTVGTSEAVAFGIRFNGTTDIALGNIDLSANATNTVFSGLSQAFNGTTDYYEVYFDAPAWVTNPTNLRCYANAKFN